MVTVRIEDADGATLATVELQEQGPRPNPPTGYKGTTTFAHAGQEWVVTITVRKARPKGPRRQAKSWQG